MSEQATTSTFGALRAALPRMATWVAVMSLAVVFGLSGGVHASATTSPPTIDFTCSPSCSEPAGTEIKFTATTNAVTPAFSWDLNGDGIFGDATGQEAAFTYQKPGIYSVSVEVTDLSTKQSNIAEHKVTITSPSPPTVNFTCSPSCSAPIGTEITFKATTDAANPVFSWDLNGDGTFGDAKGQVATYRYQKAGVYPVSVEVADLSTELSNTATNKVTITLVSLQAKVTVATKGVLRAGELITFQSQSSLPSGFHPFAYRWDFNNDGRWDADTGFSAVASHRFSAIGAHTVRMQIQGIEDGVRRISVGTIVFHTAGAEPGCLHVLERGWLEFLANCIKNDNGKFSMSLDGGVSFAGLELTSSQAGAKLTLDTTGSNSGNDNPDHKWAIRSDGPVTLSLMNTALGTVTLGALDLEHHPILLPVGADAPDQNAPGLRVLSFEAQRNCTASSASTPPVVCARLPGNFAIEGSVSVYVTGAGGEDLGAALQADLNLHQPINVSGHLTLTGDATGLHVDSFSVQTSSINIGQIATINPLTLSYQRHDDHTGQNNVWTAGGGAVLRVIPANPIGVTVALRWADGGSWEVHFDVTGRIPLGPVVLTRLGGTLGFNPFLIGGNVAGTVGPLGLSAGVLYEDAHNGQPWHFQLGSEDPENDPHHVAPLFVSYPSSNLDVAVLKVGGVLDLYGDGFVSGGLNVTFRLPHISSTNPNVDVQGFVRGWFAPPSAALPHSQFQISGGVRVNVRVLISIEGEVQGFVNQ
jgi:PKD repeat protein